MSDFTNLDLLLYRATEEYCEKMAESIAATPVTGTISKRERRRFRRILRKSARPTYRWTPLKVVAVAILIALSLSFTACVSIPSVRSAIKKVLVEWCNDYIAVDFKDPTATEPSETETQTPPPSSILKKAYVADLPEGYSYTVMSDTSVHYYISYHSDISSSFDLSQKIIQGGTLWFDSNKHTVEYILIGTYDALLIEDPDLDIFTVAWQDSEYEYNIQGNFQSKEDAIAIAEKVMLN